MELEKLIDDPPPLMPPNPSYGPLERMVRGLLSWGHIYLGLAEELTAIKCEMAKLFHGGVAVLQRSKSLFLLLLLFFLNAIFIFCCWRGFVDVYFSVA